MNLESKIKKLIKKYEETISNHNEFIMFCRSNGKKEYCKDIQQSKIFILVFKEFISQLQELLK